jgi:hypothetical protein
VKDAVNIPLPEPAVRLDEMPKNKTIIAQSNTGTQTGIAWNLRREKGSRAAG